MKTNSYFKEGLFFVTLIVVMIISVGIGIMSLASASSSNVVLNKIVESQASSRTVSQYDKSVSIHINKVSFAIENYRQAITKSSKAKTSVMAVYWKIEAADSLSVLTQSHFDSIKSMLNANGDELIKLVQPKNISALADNTFGKQSLEKQQRKIKMNKILRSIELNLNQLASH